MIVLVILTVVLLVLAVWLGWNVLELNARVDQLERRADWAGEIIQGSVERINRQEQIIGSQQQNLTDWAAAMSVQEADMISVLQSIRDLENPAPVTVNGTPEFNIVVGTPRDELIAAIKDHDLAGGR